jgi:hypothetical protein
MRGRNTALFTTCGKPVLNPFYQKRYGKVLLLGLNVVSDFYPSENQFIELYGQIPLPS